MNYSEQFINFNRIKVTSGRILLGSALPKGQVGMRQKGN
jgi:hypothetical protein